MVFMKTWALAVGVKLLSRIGLFFLSNYYFNTLYIVIVFEGLLFSGN
jgi:hypothetical protein